MPFVPSFTPYSGQGTDEGENGGVRRGHVAQQPSDSPEERYNMAWHFREDSLLRLGQKSVVTVFRRVRHDSATTQLNCFAIFSAERSWRTDLRALLPIASWRNGSTYHETTLSAITSG